MKTELGVLENLEHILKSRRDDKHARFVALDIVRQRIQAVKPAPVSPRRSARPRFTAAAVMSPPPSQAATQSFDTFWRSRKAGDKASKQRIIDALKQGQKIPAIKEVRMATGLGLKEAKDIVEGHSELARYYVAPKY